MGGGRSEEIPLSKAVNVLTADLIRLKRMGYFAEKFKTLAYDRRVDIAGKEGTCSSSYLSLRLCR